MAWRYNSFVIFGGFISLFLIVFLLGGLFADVHRKDLTVHFDAGIEETSSSSIYTPNPYSIDTWHDDENKVTCWVGTFHQSISISCFPDSVIVEEAGAREHMPTDDDE